MVDIQVQLLYLKVVGVIFIDDGSLIGWEPWSHTSVIKQESFRPLIPARTNKLSSQEVESSVQCIHFDVEDGRLKIEDGKSKAEGVRSWRVSPGRRSSFLPFNRFLI